VQKKLAAIRARESVAEAHNTRVLECLVEAADHAGKRGVKLAVENREYYEAVPLDREFANFLQRLESPHAGYWHDFGHAQIKHNLGLIDHAQHLAAMAPRLLGCHVHDTRWPFRDHCPPFTGDTPFDRLVPLLPEKCTVVFEMSPRTETADLLESAAEWKRRYC
jgi:sugar phosphate isomerase/epimerase